MSGSDHEPHLKEGRLRRWEVILSHDLVADGAADWLSAQSLGLTPLTCTDSADESTRRKETGFE